MENLWRYKNNQSISPMETEKQDNQFFIYDSRDPVSNTTRWISADLDYTLDIESIR